MKSKKLIIVDKDNNELKCMYYNNNRPHIIYNDTTYNSILPGELLKHDAIKDPKPLPKNVYGFIINDLIVLKTGSNFKILNPGYNIYVEDNKNPKLNLAIKIITPIIILIILVLLIIFTF